MFLGKNMTWRHCSGCILVKVMLATSCEISSGVWLGLVDWQRFYDIGRICNIESNFIAGGGNIKEGLICGRVVMRWCRQITSSYSLYQPDISGQCLAYRTFRDWDSNKTVMKIIHANREKFSSRYCNHLCDQSPLSDPTGLKWKLLHTSL